MIEKENEEVRKREFKTEMRNKGAESRRTVGLIAGGVGGILYLMIGLSQIKESLGNPYLSYNGITALIAGIISMVGTLVGIRNIKAGGILNLASIPTSLVIGFILLIISGYWYSLLSTFPFIFAMLYPLPFPHSFHVISGGILCLTGSDIR